MTNKTQSMLTIALTFAVTVLLVDRIIEPAQAQDCASTWDVVQAVGDAQDRIEEIIEEEVDRAYQRTLFCMNGSGISMNGANGTLYTFCDK